jgi:hypothetical protein
MQLKITKEDNSILNVEYSETVEFGGYLFFFTNPMIEFLNSSIMDTLKNVTLEFTNSSNELKTINANIETLSYATDHGRMAFKI